MNLNFSVIISKLKKIQYHWFRSSLILRETWQMHQQWREILQYLQSCSWSILKFLATFFFFFFSTNFLDSLKLKFPFNIPKIFGSYYKVILNSLFLCHFLIKIILIFCRIFINFRQVFSKFSIIISKFYYHFSKTAFLDHRRQIVRHGDEGIVGIKVFHNFCKKVLWSFPRHGLSSVTLKLCFTEMIIKFQNNFFKFGKHLAKRWKFWWKLKALLGEPGTPFENTKFLTPRLLYLPEKMPTRWMANAAF